MITGLEKIYTIAAYAIHETMFLCETARPASCKHVFEWLGFPDSCEWVAQDAFDKFEGAKRGFAVVFDPITKILPKLGMEYGYSLNAGSQGLSPGGTVRAILACLFGQWLGATQSAVVAHSWATSEGGPSP